MAVSATPLFDKQGVIIGARGIDITELDGQNTQIAGELRRAEAIRHILACVGEEAGTEAMMKAALWALIRALGAEGGAVFRNGPEGGRSMFCISAARGALAILPMAAELVAREAFGKCRAPSLDERFVLTMPCRTRFGPNAGLAIWRNSNARPWDEEDTLLSVSAVNLVGMILDCEAVAQEMVRQASIDS
jgi:hypothetical protein